MKKVSLFLMLISLWGGLIVAQKKDSASIQSLTKEMSRLNVNTVLIIPSEAVEEYPVWSPDGKFLGVNISGQWYSVNLERLSLIEGKWRGNNKLGVINTPSSVKAEPAAEKWRDDKRFAPRKIVTKENICIELAADEFSTIFRITENGKDPVVMWKSQMENCHSISLSPDHTMAAFICELNGVIIYKIK